MISYKKSAFGSYQAVKALFISQIILVQWITRRGDIYRICLIK